MRQCFHCDQPLPEGAVFCPACGNGAPVPAPTPCVHCATPIPDGARFCPGCGRPTVPPKRPEGALPITVITERDIRVAFDRAFATYLQEDYPKLDPAPFYARLESSDFRRVRDTKLTQLQRDTLFMQDRAHRTEAQWSYLAHAFYDLLDYFVVRYCRDLTGDPLPETILQYQHKPIQEINLFQLMLDYLELDRLEERVYTDFVRDMPADKLRNASHSFLFPPKNERILFISDQSTFGSVREGYAMTEAAIYWKAHFEPAAYVRYDNLRAVRREQKWISVNGLFFNVSPAINLRMLKLLRKLQFLYNPALV